MLYWPEFEFDFRLEVKKLLPHIAAIETLQEAAANRVLPPAWREQPPRESAAPPQESAHASDRPSAPRIASRKEDLLMRNAGATQAWVRDRFRPGSPPIALADVLAMHTMVADETGLRYKTENSLRAMGVLVGRREVGGIHSGAPPERLSGFMDRYVRFIDSEAVRIWPPGVHSLLAHFFFTTIHPFDDGNGRVSRLISAAILFQRGYSGHGFHAFAHHFYQNDIKYHSLLHECWQKPLPFDLTAFVAFGLEGLVAELQGINNFLKVKLRRVAEADRAASGSSPENALMLHRSTMHLWDPSTPRHSATRRPSLPRRSAQDDRA